MPGIPARPPVKSASVAFQFVVYPSDDLVSRRSIGPEQAGYGNRRPAYGQVSIPTGPVAPVSAVPILCRRGAKAHPCTQLSLTDDRYPPRLALVCPVDRFSQAVNTPGTTRPIFLIQTWHANPCRDATQRRFRVRRIFPITMAPTLALRCRPARAAAAGCNRAQPPVPDVPGDVSAATSYRTKPSSSSCAQSWTCLID
jgi:hypothetical protein